MKSMLNGIEVELNPPRHEDVMRIPQEVEKDAKSFLDWHHNCIVYYTNYLKPIQEGVCRYNRYDFIKNIPALEFPSD